jgi:hypothetical protein
MKDEFKFGEKIDGFEIPVLNEREIRAASGIMFLFALISFLNILYKKDFLLAKFFVLIFVLDFIIRVFVNPRFSPLLIFGRMIVKNQTPEYVGAPQKKFAWKIGLTLSFIMFLLLNVLNTYSIFTGLICFVCLIFLFFESSFGICLGCIFYRRFTKHEIKYCPGEICEIKERTSIQKVSRKQLLILFAFLFSSFLLVFLLKSAYSTPPENLWVKVGLKK